MIKCKYDCGFYKEDFNLLVCRPNAELSADKMNDIATCRECIQKEEHTQVNRFHDLRGISSINLRFDDIRLICDSESKLRKLSMPIKACYLVDNALLYGTVRMYQALIQSSGVEVHVSYDINKICEILKVEKSAITSEPEV